MTPHVRWRHAVLAFALFSIGARATLAQAGARASAAPPAATVPASRPAPTTTQPAAAAQPSAAGQPVTRLGAGPADSAATVSRGNPAPRTVQHLRESYRYAGDGRRDPYASLMSSGEIRPLLSDLRLTAVAYDPVGRGSVAILRDVVSQAQHRVRVGQVLGRLRVAAIRQKAVIFSIDEFGFSRQETLPLTSDSTTTRQR
jgi:hypothetical protein